MSTASTASASANASASASAAATAALSVLAIDAAFRVLLAAALRHSLDLHLSNSATEDGTEPLLLLLLLLLVLVLLLLLLLVLALLRLQLLLLPHFCAAGTAAS